MILDPKTIPAPIAYQILTGSVIPRPIGLISSISAAGMVNLAPFSFFNAICGEPPMVMFCPMNRRPPKDTLVNVKATREFVANIVSEEIAQQMNLTSGDYASEINEFDISGLTPAACEVVKPPRVLESPVSMECIVHHIIEVSDKPPGAATLSLRREWFASTCAIVSSTKICLSIPASSTPSHASAALPTAVSRTASI